MLWQRGRQQKANPVLEASHLALSIAPDGFLPSELVVLVLHLLLLFLSCNRSKGLSQDIGNGIIELSLFWCKQQQRCYLQSLSG